ncbi:MAG: Ig-like domain-containing protein [Bacteroidota bacterium]
MNSFTSYILNKAHKLQGTLHIALCAFMLLAFQQGYAQCPNATATPQLSTVCSGTIISIILTSDQPGTTYTWTSVQTDVVGGVDGGGSTIADTLTATDVFQGSVVYTVTPFTASCPGGGPAIAVNVAVNPIPLAIATPLNSTICSGATSAISLTSDVAGTTFTWTVIQAAVSGGSPGAGFSIAQTLNTTGNSAGIATYNIVPTASNCVGEAINARVTVRQLPVITLGANPIVCQGATTANLTYSATGGSPNQYSVDYDGTAEAQGFVDVLNAALPASPIVLVVPGGAAIGTYNAVVSVRNSINGCPGASYPITITVSEAPTVANAGPNQTPACGVTSVTLAANTPLVGTGSWSIISGLGGSFVSSTTPGTVFNGVAGTTYVLRWTISNPPCPPSTSDVTITLTQAPTTAAAGPDQTACGTSTALAANTPLIGTGSWSIFSGAGGSFVLSGDPTTVFNGVAGNTYVLVWTISNAPCPSSTDTVTITLSPSPTTAIAGPDQSICANSTSLAANAPLIGTGSWSIISGLGGSFVSSVDPATIFNGVSGNAYVLRWTISNAPCPPSTSDVNISFSQPATIAAAGPDQTSCGLTSATLAANTPAIGTGNWSIISGAGGSFVSSADPATVFNGVLGTTYVLRWTISNAPCPASTSDVTITFTQAPTTAIAGPDQTSCGVTSATLAANTPATGTGNWSVFSGLGGSFVLANDPGTVFNGTLGNTYVLVWTISNAPCAPSTDSVTITLGQPSSVAAAGPDQTDACGSSSVTLAANTPLAGTGSWSIISGAGGSIVSSVDPSTLFNGTAGNTYVLRWTISSPPCPVSFDDVTITFNVKPDLFTTPQSICSPATTVNLTLPAVTAGSTPGLTYTYFTDAGATSVYGTPNAATSGTYYIVGTLGGACSDTAGVNVTVNPSPNVVTSNQTVCSPATVDLTAGPVTVGSTGGLVFSYFTDPGATTVYGTPTVATAGTYYIVGTTAFGCRDTTAVTVTVNTTPNVVTTPQAACSPARVNLTLPAVTATSTPPGLTFTYYTDAAATSAYLTPTLATTGTYYIVGTLSGCADTTAVTVTINAKPTVNTVNPATVCAPATIDLTAAGVTAGSTPIPPGLTFTYFTNAAATSSYATPATATSGTYYIVGTTAAGCSDTTAVTASITPKPVVNTVAQTACTPATVNLTSGAVTAGSTGGLSFTYFTDAAATSPYGTPGAATTGTYYIVGTTAGGCSDTTAVTVTINTSPTVTTHDPASVCSPATVDLTAGAVTAGSVGVVSFTYFTDAGATSAVATPAAVTTSGTYYIVGTSAAGCRDLEPVTVIVNISPTVVTSPIALCLAGSADLTDPAVTSGSSGVALFTYFMDAGATTTVPDETAVGPGTYYIMGTSAAGCTDITPVDVAALPVIVTAPIMQCHPDTTTDLANGIISPGTTPGLTYTYFTDAGATAPYLPFASAAPGTYYVVGTTADGCTDTATIVFSVNPKPTVLTVPQSICAPSTINLTAGAVTAGSTGGLSYTYFTNAAATATYATPATAGSGTYYIVGTTGFGCSDTTAVTVTINAQPSVLTTNQAACAPTTTTDLTLAAVTAGSDPGLNYTYFTNPAGTIPVGTPTAVTAGAYYIRGTIPGAGGCSAITAVIFTVNPKPAIVTNPQSTCQPGTIDLTDSAVTTGSSGGLTFTYFTDAAATSSFGTPTAAGAGTYYIVGVTAQGCSDTAAVVVTINPKPTLITVAQSVCAPATSVDLTAAGVTAGSAPIPPGLTFTYFTDPGATSPYGSPTLATTGTYYIVANSGAGCADTASVAVAINTKPLVNTVPQAICNPATTVDITLPAVTAGSTGGLSYTYFTDPGATTTFLSPGAAVSGTYYIVGVDLLTGCADTTGITVTVNTKPVVTTNDPAPICSPATVNLTLAAVTAGSTGGLTFSYYTDAGATSVYGTPAAAVAGTYYIVGVTIAGCSDTTVVNVVSDAIPNVVTVPQSICSPALTVDLTDSGVTTGSTGGLTFAVYTNPGATILYGSPAAATAGTYYIVGSTPGGCTDTASVVVTVDAGPNTGTVSGTSPLCIGATATYTSNGDPAGTWSSTDPTVASVNAGTGLVTALLAGTTDITYTLIGCNGPVTSILTLTVSPNVNAGIVSGTTPLCIGATNTYTSNGDVGGSWTSTNPAVATVNAAGLVTAILPGTTDITYTVNGCNGSASAFLTLTVSPDANAGIVSGTTPLCIGATDTYTSNGDIGGSWTSTNPAVATVNPATGLVSAVSAGTTNITYSTGGGCNSPISSFLALTVSPNVNAGAVSGNSPLCTGASDTYTSNGDIGGLWSSSDPLVATVVAATGVVTTVAPGTATITYTVTGCAGPAVSSLILTVDPTNSGTVSGTTPLCIGGSAFYSSNGDPAGTWASTNPVVASVNSGTGEVTALTAGTTDITYTLIGCSTSSLLTLTVSPNVTGGIISGTTPLCINDFVTFTSSGDAGGSWSSSDPLVATVVAGTGVVTAASAGTANIIYTVNGCNGPASALLALTVSPAVNAGIVSGTTPLCIGASAAYTSNGDIGGTWTSTNPLVATVVAGTGVVTAVNPGTTDITYTVNGCGGPVFDILTLTVDPNANTGAVSGLSPLCIGATNVYTSNGDGGGSWSSSDLSVATVNAGTGEVTAVGAGTANIVYTLNSGCNNPVTSLLALTVTPNATAGVVSGTSPLCIATTATFTSNGDAGGSWSSSDPLVATVNAVSGLVTAVSAGNANITYTVNGCNGPASALLALTVNPTNSGTVSGATPLCIGGSALFTSDGDPGGTWASTNPLVATVIAGTGVVTAVSAGTTDITYTLPGCSVSSLLTLTVNPNVNAGTITGITPLCIGTSDTYTSNGDIGGTWSSTDPAVATVNAVTGLVTALTAGTTDISYTVNGCNGPDVETLSLTVDPINSGTISGTTPLCIGATDLYATDGTLGGAWASTVPAVATVNAVSGLVTAVSAGTTDITYTLVGCNASSSLTLTVNPNVNAGNLSVVPSLCIGASDTYTSDGDAGGTWTSSNPLVATIIAGTGVVTAVSAGTSTITYTVLGCNGPDDQFLTLTVLPDANAGVVSGTTPLCIGASATYTSNGDPLGTWSSTNPLIATVIAGTGVVTAVSAGTSNITYTVNGCNGPATASLLLTVDPNANSGIVSGTTPLCIGATANYTSDGDIGGTWSSSNPAVATVDALGLVTAVSAGTSNITYTVNSGCNNPFSSILALTVNPDANAGIVSGSTPLCIGAAGNFTSNGDALGSWSSTNPLVATVVAGTGVVTAVSAGTADITYTVNGCNGPDAAFLTLTVNPDVIAGIVSGTSPLCITATANYTSTGDVGGTWSSTNPLVATVSLTGVVTAVAAGTTSITYTVSGCNGPLSAFQALTVDPNATAGVISGTSPLCIGASDPYSSTGDAGGSWSSSDPLVATVIPGTGVVTAVSAGTTNITYTVSTGCNNPASAFVSLTVSPNVNAGIVSGVSPLCAGATGAFTSDGDLGGSWSSTDPLVATVIAGTGIVTAVGAGVANITYTVNGCNGPASAFQALTVNSTPVVTASGTNLSCFNTCTGVALALVAGGNPLYAYNWSTGINDTIALTLDSITGLCAGGYTVTVTDANGCSDVDSVIITQPTQISPNVTTTNTTCNGVCDGTAKSVPTDGTSPYTFAWSTGSIDSVVTGLCAGTYTVIVTDASGCSTTSTVIISEAPAVLANAVITNATCGLCNGQAQLVPSGGVTPYTYLWGNGQTTDTISNLCAGLYSVNIIDSIGCSVSFSIPISNPGGVTDVTITSTNVTCFGLCDGAVTATTPVGGTAPYVFLWIPGGETTTTLSNLCSGTYYVQVADSSGCAFIDSVIIAEPAQMLVNPFVTTASCGVCDGSLTIAPSGGVSPYTVLWNNASTADTLLNLCAGLYSVQVTDASGCGQNVVLPLSTQNGPTLTTSLTPLLCNNACTATATVVAAGGITPYTYLWNDVGAQTNATATALCSGTYFIQVTGGTCVSFASVIIDNPAPIGFAFANSVNPSCNGTSDGAITVIPSGGTLPYTYSWTSSASVSDTANTLASGIFTVTVTDANGCTGTQTNTLVDPASLTIADSVTNASCNTIADGAINITVGGGTPGYTYQWSGGSGLTTEDLTNILSRTYTVTVTDNNGCVLADTVTVGSTVTVVASAGNDTTFCEPGTVLLNAAGSSVNVVNYQWFQILTAADSLLASAVSVSAVPPSDTTSYYVMVDNGAGCSNTDTVVVVANPLPVVNAGADVSILLSASAVIGGNPTGPVGSTYSWTAVTGLDNSTIANPVATPTETTTYTVTVTSAQGCIASDMITVTVVANITFANGISPNGDGTNEEWIIDKIDLFPNCVVEIYNRWGELLFQSQGYTETWKGMYKGELLPVGTYYYIINLNDPLFPDAFTGPITILR